MINKNLPNNDISQLKEILTKKNRNLKDINFIYKKLKHTPIFNTNNKFSLEELVEFCKNINYAEYSTNYILIKENEKINLNLYYILEGKVAIFKKQSLISNFKSKIYDTNLSDILKNKLKINESSREITRMCYKNHDFKNKILSLGNFVRTIKKNNIIGDKGFLNEI